MIESSTNYHSRAPRMSVARPTVSLLITMAMVPAMCFNFELKSLCPSMQTAPLVASYVSMRYTLAAADKDRMVNVAKVLSRPRARHALTRRSATHEGYVGGQVVPRQRPRCICPSRYTKRNSYYFRSSSLLGSTTRSHGQGLRPGSDDPERRSSVYESKHGRPRGISIVP